MAWAPDNSASKLSIPEVKIIFETNNTSENVPWIKRTIQLELAISILPSIDLSVRIPCFQEEFFMVIQYFLFLTLFVCIVNIMVSLVLLMYCTTLCVSRFLHTVLRLWRHTQALASWTNVSIWIVLEAPGLDEISVFII